MDPVTLPYLPFLERVLTPHRLQHSLNVMTMMDDLSGIYRLDRDRAVLAGLLHDAAKDITPEQREQLIAEAGIPNQEPWERDYVFYQHGPVGAYFVRKELGITDPVILDAITMHTYCGEGENFYSALVWCLRFSDILEPGRHWDENTRWLRDGEPLLRELVFGGRLDEAAFFQTGLLLRFRQDRSGPIHPQMRQAHLDYAARTGLDDSWFDFDHGAPSNP